MITLDEMEAILDEIATDFPQDIYKELNGGILLLPDVKLNAMGRNNDLYILGEYCSGGNLGRYITIYYGSFMRLYGDMEKENLKKRLMHTLKHEFTHHLESLAGEKDLEIEDAKYMEDYLNHNGR